MEEHENPLELLFEKQINELKNSGKIVTNEDELNYFLLASPESLAYTVNIVDTLPNIEEIVEYVKNKLLLEYQKR